MPSLGASPTEISILDCTLRDGSYQVDFGFSVAQTLKIAKSLVESGADLVEVGHGVGIGASKAIKPALQSDLEYAKAAEKGAPGQWGMFAIPEIASFDEIVSLVDSGMSFIRIGVDMEKRHLGYEMIGGLRKRFPKLRIFMNFMKSYTVEVQAFGSAAREALESGASGVYLVDSAGGMTPEQTASYASEILPLKERGMLGFHGHDNLGLAVGNSLKVATMGFDVLDTTLMGLGRSSGNAPTERVAALLLKLGLRKSTSLDLVRLCRLAEDEISSLPQSGKSHGLDVMAGYTDFHSSFMTRLIAEASRSHVDPFELMKCVTQVDKVNAEEDIIRECAKKLPMLEPDVADRIRTGYSEADNL